MEKPERTPYGEYFIDRFKYEDGYKDEDDCCYDDAEDFLTTKILGFCGCGIPMAAAHFVRDALQNVEDKMRMGYDEGEKLANKIYSNDCVKYFTWYVLHEKGFTEHGGSVPGWLTVKGQELLHDLNVLIYNKKHDS